MAQKQMLHPNTSPASSAGSSHDDGAWTVGHAVFFSHVLLWLVKASGAKCAPHSRLLWSASLDRSARSGRFAYRIHVAALCSMYVHGTRLGHSFFSDGATTNNDSAPRDDNEQKWLCGMALATLSHRQKKAKFGLVSLVL